MSQLTLTQLGTVKQFFAQGNWEGKKLVRQEKTVEAEKPLLSWSVAEFFHHYNWQGKPKELDTNTPETKVLIAQTVQDFFAYLSWEGKAQVAPNPQPITTRLESSETSNSQMNLEDLSDLF